jgi:hypothetical protein
MIFTFLWISIMNLSNICWMCMLLSLLPSVSIWMMRLDLIIRKSGRALIISYLFTDHLLLLYSFLHHIPTCFIIRISTLSTCHLNRYSRHFPTSWLNEHTVLVTSQYIYVILHCPSYIHSVIIKHDEMHPLIHLFIFTQFPCFSSFLTYSLFCMLIHLQRQIVLLSSHS